MRNKSQASQTSGTVHTVANVNYLLFITSDDVIHVLFITVADSFFLLCTYKRPAQRSAPIGLVYVNVALIIRCTVVIGYYRKLVSIALPTRTVETQLERNIRYYVEDRDKLRLRANAVYGFDCN
jgi:hypothetical protein